MIHSQRESLVEKGKKNKSPEASLKLVLIIVLTFDLLPEGHVVGKNKLYKMFLVT